MDHRDQTDLESTVGYSVAWISYYPSRILHRIARVMLTEILFVMLI